jgi:hypothetical protein
MTTRDTVHRALGSAIVLAAIVPFACAGLGRQRTASARASETIPIPVAGACDPAQRGEWEFIRDSQQAVRARARNEWEWIGVTAATDGFHDWAPLDSVKTTVCGTLAHFKTFEPNRQHFLLATLPELPEHDWNIFVKPATNTVFSERFNLAMRMMERGHEGDVMKCRGTGGRDDLCFEAEITAPPHLRTANVAKEWLSVFRRGQGVCVYGPWVGDGGHGYRPEIHPAERIWWREDDRLTLMFVQDASQRFGDHRHFRWHHSEHEGWQPWARYAIEGSFRVAFQMEESSTAAFEIQQLLERNTKGVPSPVPGAQREVSRHQLDFDLQRGGTSVGTMTVRLGVGEDSNRLQLALDHFGIKPVDVCLDGSSLRGLLELRQKIGSRQEDGEGFEVLEVSSPQIARPVLDRRDEAADAASPPAELQVHVEVTARERDDRPLLGRPDALLSDLLRAAAADIGPSEDVVVSTQPLEEIFRQRRPQMDLGRTGRFSVSARPHYDGPRGERINDAFEKRNLDDFRQLLDAAGATVPTRIDWRWDVQDFTDATLPPAALSTTCRKERLEEDTCDVTLPEDRGDHVLRIVATANVLASGSRQMRQALLTPGTAAGDLVREQGVRLASHFIVASRRSVPDTVLRWLSDAYRQPEILVLADGDTELLADPGLMRYRKGFRARMLKQGIVLSTVDDRITVDELRQFARMAQSFGETREPGPTRAPATIK